MSPPTNSSRIAVSTPGRVCLFGEHQDYLGLPVIAAAISLRIQVELERVKGGRVELELPDLSSRISFDLNNTLPYTNARDYLRSSINVLKRQGFSFSSGLRGTVRGNIPINAGTSSSSALVVSWIHALTQVADTPRAVSSAELARWAHEAEVLEFREPGGMMDHISTASGGVMHIEFQPEPRVNVVHPTLGSFVLGDSREPKNTTSVLARVKTRVLDVVEGVRTHIPNFSLHTVNETDLEAALKGLRADEESLLRGTVHNRNLTREAFKLLSAKHVDEQQFGTLMNEHQSVLREVLGISTPKIDRMIDGALNAGALGAKINGSGGGGCMFAYTPNDPERIAEAIEREGGRAYIVHVAEGSRRESQPPSTT